MLTGLEVLEFFVMLLMDLVHFWHMIKKCFRIEKHDIRQAALFYYRSYIRMY